MSHRRHTNRLLASLGAIMLVGGCGDADTPDSAQVADTASPRGVQRGPGRFRHHRSARNQSCVD